jgi:hypothetical protein
VYALDDWELTIGSFGGSITVADGFAGTDAYQVYTSEPPEAWTVLDLEFVLSRSDTTVFDSDALPLTPPDPLVFESSFSIAALAEDGNFLSAVGGEVTSITVSAPGALIVLGMPGVERVRRRRRRAA